MPKRWQRRARKMLMDDLDAVLENFPKEKALIESIPDKEKRQMLKLRILSELKKGVAAQSVKN